MSRATFKKTFKYQIRSLGREGCFTLGYHIRELIEKSVDYKKPWLVLEDVVYKKIMRLAFRNFFMLNIYKNASSVLLGKYALIDMNKFVVKEDKESRMIQEKKIKRGEVQEDPVLSRYLNLSQRRK